MPASSIRWDSWYSHDLPAESRQPTQYPESQGPASPETSFRLISVSKVAEMLGVVPITVYRIVARRELPVYRIARKISFKESDVLAWIERCKTEAEPYA